MLGLSFRGGARLDTFLRWSDQPLVKFAEGGLVFLLTVHLLGGLRVLVIENFDWRDGQKQLATLAAAVVGPRRRYFSRADVLGDSMNVEHLKTDILILGSGGAGLFAALHALKANPDLDITVASKGLLGKCGCTRMVQGGYNVALNPGDSIERHFMDTIEGGKWLPHQELAWTLVTKAIERVRELENEIGCFFDRNPDGTLHGKAFAGQSFDRTVHKGDLTGIEIINRLMEQVWARPIRRLEEHRAVALIPTPDGALSGVLMIDVRTGDFRFVSAQAVLLATGGGPTMYRYHTPSGDKTMDGLAMALRLGLPLRDMEMVQFHPTGLFAGPGYPHDRNRTGRRLARRRRPSAQRRDAPLHGRLRSEARARHARRGQPRYRCGNARRPHHAERRRLYQDGSSRPGQCRQAIQGHGGSLPRLRLRSCRRLGRSGADRALFHGRRGLRGRHRDRTLSACLSPARTPAACMAPTGSAATASPIRPCSAASPAMSCRSWIAKNPGHRPPDTHVLDVEIERTLHPFSRKPGDLNALREKLLDTMWDEVGVVRDRASIERGLAGIDASKRNSSPPALPMPDGSSI